MKTDRALADRCPGRVRATARGSWLLIFNMDFNTDFWKQLAGETDARLAAGCLRVFPASSTLLIFVFHSLFESAEEVALNGMDPQQRITTGMFRSFVADLRENGYRFVSPPQIRAGLERGGNYALITFDDGYANNRRALAALEEFQAPAVFCISCNHVLGQAFLVGCSPPRRAETALAAQPT